MNANIVPADQVRELPGGTLADGRKAKIRIGSTGQDITIAILVQEPGAVDYYGIGARVFTADDYKMVESILKSAQPSLWDASWQELEDGGSFTWGDNTQTGSSAVSLRFAFEVRNYTTRAIIQSTSHPWMDGVFAPFIQQLINDSVAANPPNPLPPVVLNPYDPNAVGQCFQANIVVAMQAPRLSVVNGVVLVGPVP